MFLMTMSGRMTPVVEIAMPAFAVPYADPASVENKGQNNEDGND